MHTLVLGGHFTKSGFLCPRDHLLSTHEETCPLCGGAMEKTDDLAEEMVAGALAQGAEVEHIFEAHEDFEKYQAGALLRFSLGFRNATRSPISGYDFCSGKLPS